MSSDTVSSKQRFTQNRECLFYSEGIHTIGVDRLVDEAGVTPATFYQHFPTKEALVEAYLSATGRRPRANVDNALKDRHPQQALEALRDLIGQRTNTPGCQSINADALSDTHASWVVDQFRSQLNRTVSAAPQR